MRFSNGKLDNFSTMHVYSEKQYFKISIKPQRCVLRQLTYNGTTVHIYIWLFSCQNFPHCNAKRENIYLPRWFMVRQIQVIDNCHQFKFLDRKYEVSMFQLSLKSKTEHEAPLLQMENLQRSNFLRNPTTASI